MTDLPDPKYTLREARENELETLIEKTEKYLPHSLTVYRFLSVGFRRKLLDREFTKIYIPVSEELPLFIVITGVVRKVERNNASLFWNPNEISKETAKQLLKSLPHWNWEEPIYVHATDIRTLKEVDKIITEYDGLANRKLHLSDNDTVCCNCFHTSAYILVEGETVPEVRISDEFFLAPLDASFAQAVYDGWGYVNDTVEGIQKYMTALPAVAAFTKRTPGRPGNNETTNMDTSNPVSWAAPRLTGEIGFTFTKPEYRNKGLATAVTTEMAKRLLELQITPYVVIDDKNEDSKRFHEKIGFRKYCSVGYYIYLTDGMAYADF